MLRAQVLREWRDAAEVEQGAAILLIGMRGLGVRQAEVVMLTVPLERTLGAPEAMQDLDDLAAAFLAHHMARLLARQVGGDVVDAEPSFGDVIDGANRTRQHRQPDLADAQSDELIDLLRLRSQICRKRERVLSSDPPGGQQDVLKAVRILLPQDVTSVLVAAAKSTIRHAKELIIIIAQCGERRDFAAAFGDADGRGGRNHERRSSAFGSPRP